MRYFSEQSYIEHFGMTPVSIQLFLILLVIFLIGCDYFNSIKWKIILTLPRYELWILLKCKYTSIYYCFQFQKNNSELFPVFLKRLWQIFAFKFMFSCHFIYCTLKLHYMTFFIKRACFGIQFNFYIKNCVQIYFLIQTLRFNICDKFTYFLQFYFQMQSCKFLVSLRYLFLKILMNCYKSLIFDISLLAAPNATIIFKIM